MDGISSQYSPMPRANLFRSPVSAARDDSELSDHSFSFSPAQRLDFPPTPPAQHPIPHKYDSRSSLPSLTDKREPTSGKSLSPESSPSRGWPSGLFDSDAFPSESSIKMLRAEQDHRMGVTRANRGGHVIHAEQDLSRRNGEVSPLERFGRYISGSKQELSSTVTHESKDRRGRLREQWMGGAQEKYRHLTDLGASRFKDATHLPPNANNRYAVSPPPPEHTSQCPKRDTGPVSRPQSQGPTVPSKFTDAPRVTQGRQQPPLQRQPGNRFRTEIHKSSDGNFERLSTDQEVQTEYNTLVGGCFPTSRTPSPEPRRPPPPLPRPEVQEEGSHGVFLSTSPFSSLEHRAKSGSRLACASLSPPTPPHSPQGYSPQSQKGMFFPAVLSDGSDCEQEEGGGGARLYQGFPVEGAQNSDEQGPELSAEEAAALASGGTVYGVPVMGGHHAPHAMHMPRAMHTMHDGGRQEVMGARAGGVGVVETPRPPVLQHGSLVTLVMGGTRLAAVQQGGRWILGHPRQSLWEEGPEVASGGDGSWQSLGLWPLECLFVLLCTGDGRIGLRSVVAEGRVLSQGQEGREGFSSWSFGEAEMWRVPPAGSDGDGGWSEGEGGVVEGSMVLTAASSPHKRLQVLLFGLMAKSLRAWRQLEENAVATPILRFQLAQLRTRFKELMEQSARGKDIDRQEAARLIDHLTEEVSHLRRELATAEERVADAAETGMAQRLEAAESQLAQLREKVGQLEAVEQEAEALRDHLRKLQDKELQPPPPNAACTSRQRPKWGAPLQRPHTHVDHGAEGGPLLRRKMSVSVSAGGGPSRAEGGSGGKRVRVQRLMVKGSTTGLLSKSCQTPSPLQLSFMPKEIPPTPPVATATATTTTTVTPTVPPLQSPKSLPVVTPPPSVTKSEARKQLPPVNAPSPPPSPRPTPPPSPLTPKLSHKSPPVTDPPTPPWPPVSPAVPSVPIAVETRQASGVSRSAIKRRVSALRGRVAALKDSQVEVEVEVEKENARVSARGKAVGERRTPLQSVGQGGTTRSQWR